MTMTTAIRGLGLALILMLAACGRDAATPPPSTTTPLEPATWKPPKGLSLPVITARGLAAVSTDAIAVVVTPAAIIVEGEVVLALRDGVVDPAELEGGALGKKLPRLVAYMTQVQAARIGAKSAPATPPIALLLVDKHLGYNLLYQLMYSIKLSGLRQFEIVALADDQPVAITIRLPDMSGRPSVGIPDGQGGVRAVEVGPGGKLPDRIPPAPLVSPVVSVARDEVRVWSISGVEGTLLEPKLNAANDAAAPPAVSATLAEIVTRRWSGARRDEVDRQIILMADPATPMQRVADYLVAVRADATGAELFPDVLLAAGFE